MHVFYLMLINCSGIVLSRKRKLRELYAVCDNEFPIPQIDLTKPDAPPFNSKEAQFLERTDILRYGFPLESYQLHIVFEVGGCARVVY